MMSLTRSTGMVEPVCPTGTVPPAARRRRDVPGLQSRKYSPISDCGRVSQNASVRRSPNPAWSTRTPIFARMSERSSAIDVTFPARTPATLTSAPSISPKALSSSTKYSLPPPSPPEPMPSTTSATTTTATAAKPKTLVTGQHLARVAVEARRRLPRVGAVVVAVLHRARAAVVLPALGRRRGHRRAQRLRDQLERAVDGGERVDRRRDAAGRAVGVVDAGVAEVVDPAGAVDCVGAEERICPRLALERVGGRRARTRPLLAVALHRADGDVAQRRHRAGQLVEVVARAGAPDEIGQAADGRLGLARERAQLGEHGAQARRHRLGVLDEPVEVVERRAQVDEGRVRPAHET